MIHKSQGKIDLSPEPPTGKDVVEKGKGKRKDKVLM